MSYKYGSPYQFRTMYSKEDDGWYCEIYSRKTGRTLATTGVHRHAENAEIEAAHIIDHLNGDDDVRLLEDDIS